MSQEAAATRTQPATPDPALKKLNVFVGKWNTEGQQHEGLVGPAAKISAVETFEWLTGDFFLIHRFDGKVGDGETACIEITGYDPTNDSYPVHTFYNNGIATEWEYHEREGVWTLTGGWEMEGKAMKVRCIVKFSDGGSTMTGKFEHSSHGSNWQAFWDVKATKAV